jgi:hypothetical protein
VSMVLPGRRTDPAHLTAFQVSSALVAAWPDDADTGDLSMTPGLPDELRARLVRIGGVSRLPVAPSRSRRPGARRAVVLQGRGGQRLTEHLAPELEVLLPGWEWTVLGGEGTWADDPRATLMDADVVVTNAGQGSVADVAACRKPAVVVPSPRPYAEQVATAEVLGRGRWPVVAATTADEALTPEVLDRAQRLDGNAWAGWCDDGAPTRFASLVRDLSAPRVRPPTPGQVPA